MEKLLSQKNHYENRKKIYTAKIEDSEKCPYQKSCCSSKKKSNVECVWTEGCADFYPLTLAE
jgi:hypothetical protein